MRKIPKEMKVVIIGMLIECIILYGVYKFNTVNIVSSTKDNATTYMNLDNEEVCENFTEEEKKKINYDYEVPTNNKVCKILDEDTLLVTDNDKIKEYNYKTKQYEKYWGELEKGYELQEAEKYGNRLFYSAIKYERDDSGSVNENYYFKIKCIDKDLGKEFIIFNAKEPDKKNMRIMLQDKKLIILRYVYNRYEIGYIDVDVERFKYNKIYSDDDRNNRYSINNVYVNDNKIYWDRREKKEVSASIYSYDFESKDIESLDLEIPHYYVHNDKILFYKNEYNTMRIRDYETYQYDFFEKDDRHEKFLEAIKKYRDKNKTIFQEYSSKYNIEWEIAPVEDYSIVNWNLYGDKLLIKTTIGNVEENYFTYNYNTGDFSNINLDTKKNPGMIMEVLDIKDDIMICNLYLNDKKNKLTVVKKI